MLPGHRTAIYSAGDIARAKEWYTRVLRKGPYFDQPFYVGFNVGGFELGLDPNGKPAGGSAVAYWGVDDAEAAVARLIELGATESHAVQGVGEGIKVASVRDPFGNLVGIIENPHFPNRHG